MTAPARTWADEPMTAFDIESSGIDTSTARIVTASVVTIVGSTPRVRSWLTDVGGEEIPAEATAVHHITTEHARAHGIPAADAVRQIRDALIEALYAGRPLVIYNAPFDLTMLDRECRRYGIEPLGAARVPLRVIDPLVIDRATSYRKGSRKLVDVARHHGITLTEDEAHTSAGDCLATARVAWCLAKRTPAGRMNIDQLQAYQREAHSRWAANLEAFKRGRGEDITIPRHWPIVPFELVGAEA
ncbi:exonuclease domain-containing protein [Lentzea cavernae]|uniref:3'-5' exonuclease n=1 Tax=Lentzea cavernae TaxID=2020703 RepID=A0ABQ3MS44_9PSEU|nr:exonuclease domain-containing protein [Lentzea cavernae]GHH57402.1 3'-5' exonuclease [Lentzea cavernae]